MRFFFFSIKIPLIRVRFVRHLADHSRHWLPRGGGGGGVEGKSAIRHDCLLGPRSHVSGTCLHPLRITALICRELICMVAVPPSTPALEIGPQWGTKWAFNSNSRFNLSSIKGSQSAAMIPLLQFQEEKRPSDKPPNFLGSLALCRKFENSVRLDS